MVVICFILPVTFPHTSTLYLLLAHSRKAARDVCIYALREFCFANLETEHAKENLLCQRGSSFIS